MYRFYYQKETIGDILFIVIDALKVPTLIKRYGDVCVLYDEHNNLVGMNIYHFSQIYEINKCGMILPLPDDLLRAVNILISSYSLPKFIHEDSGFVVAKVKEIYPLEDSENLSYVSVYDGKNLISVVTASKNVKTNDLVVYAKIGTLLKDGSQLQATTMLGQKSEGMLCSARSLNIDIVTKTNEVLILNQSYKIGEDFFANGGY